MYSNIPTNELIKIIDLMCDQHDIKEELKHEIMKISKILIELLPISRHTLHARRRTCFGAPTSSIFSKIYPQHIENKNIVDILFKKRVTGHFRYVNDILIVYKKKKKNKTNIFDVLNTFSNKMPTMKFITEEEN
jgi:hypothetical protein